MSAQTLRTPAAAAPGTVKGSDHVVRSFVARRTIRGALLWGVVVGAFTASSAVGYTALAATDAERTRILAGFAANPGLAALVGRPEDITTAAGFVDWRTTGIGALVVAVWGLLAATRVLRGEEAAGRWELLVTGRTTRRGATVDALAGLGAALVAMFAVIAVLTTATGARPDMGVGPGRAALFALAVTLAAAVFAGVGALAAQLLPTRGQAAGLALAVFGVSFATRAVGDAAPRFAWVADLSPFGWVEQVRALTNPRPLWLVPLVGAVALLAAGTVALADRDIGAAAWGDRDSSPPRLGLLGGPLPLAVRLTRGSALAWLLGAVGLAALYGSITSSAAEAFANSPTLQRFGTAFTAQARIEGVELFAGVVFLVLMTVGMGCAAGAAGAIRREEALGLVENLLVRRVGRARWLAGRAALAAVPVVLLPLAGAGAFALTARAAGGPGAGELLAAGLNAAAPGLLLLGIGVLAVGWAPRATTRVAYGLLAWSFLLEMLASTVDLPEAVRATSLLHHVALAPAVAVEWGAVAGYAGLAVLAAAVGVRGFVRRDLRGE
jgi:ABC-2 type transport system permease protein